MRSDAIAVLLAILRLLDQGFKMKVYEKDGREYSIELKGWPSKELITFDFLNFGEADNIMCAYDIQRELHSVADGFDIDSRVEMHRTDFSERSVVTDIELFDDMEKWKEYLRTVASLVDILIREYSYLARADFENLGITMKSLLEEIGGIDANEVD